ncbi:MAG: hypothetical protein J6U39_02480, partial [Clostridia bacterium]|nr:hypothetical protein [Clostridia bacterium]
LDKVLSALPEREYGIFLKELDRLTYEGIEMRVFRFLLPDGERDVHHYQGDASLKEGVKYIVEIRAGVLYELEETGGQDEKEIS